MSERLEQLLERLLGHARPRTDTLDEKLVLPHQPEPWLVQRGDTLLTLTLAVELLAALERHGATSLRRSMIDEVRLRLRARFDRNRWHHLEEELVGLITWLEHALTTSAAALTPDDDDHHHHLRFDPEPRRLLAREALERHQDLYLELLDLDAMRYRRIRLRPQTLERRPPTLTAQPDEHDQDTAPTEPLDCLVGARIPEGDVVAVPLERIRWIMAVKRLSELPPGPRLAEVVKLPTRPRSDDQD